MKTDLKNYTSPFNHETQIKILRDEIIHIHTEILLLLVRRFKITQKIWEIKIAHKMKLLDRDREKALLNEIDGFEEISKDNKVYFKEIFKAIIKENKKYLLNVLENRKDEL